MIDQSICDGKQQFSTCKYRYVESNVLADEIWKFRIKITTGTVE